QLQHKGQVEVISSVERDGRPVFRDLRWGVYTVFEAPSDYAARCFAEYGLDTDPSGRYASMYKPFHLIGLELGISVASAALRGEPTGTTRAWSGDVAAVAKRDLAVGETLDGEGGFTVWGKLLPAARSRDVGALPIGLAHKLTLTRPVAKGGVVTWADVAVNEESQAMAVRREMEARF
ncbi:MAG: flagellar biosynthesis protein FlgA, partial [Limibacillus sp.]